MSKRIALAFLALASPTIVVTSLWSVPHGDVLFALIAVAFPIALIVLGAAGAQGSLGPLAWPLAGLVLFYEACVVAMLAYRGQVADGPWILGLPIAMAIQFYGIFLVPMLFVSFVYAVTFERFGLRQDDLDDLRRRFGSGS